MADLKEIQINGVVYNFKDTTARNLISALGTGSPIPVDSLEDMVDTSKIYLYTSETSGGPLPFYDKVTSFGGDRASKFMVTDNTTNVEIATKSTETGGWVGYLIDSCSLDLSFTGNLVFAYDDSSYLSLSRGISSAAKIFRYTKDGNGSAFSVIKTFNNYPYPLWQNNDNLRVTIINGVLKVVKLDDNTVVLEEDISTELSGYTPCLGICYNAYEGATVYSFYVLQSSQFLDNQGNEMYSDDGPVIHNNWYYYNGTEWVSGGTYGAGVVDLALNSTSTNAIANKTVKNALDSINERIDNIEDETLENHWEGKSWYAYGTSITNTSNEGKYATKLATMSGLLLTNKGISGGGIGDLGAYSRGQVYNAICNITDGKLNADLITLETGANDCNANVPLGTIYDTGTSTLAGCLNDCLRYLQTNTNAQIVVFNSPATTTEPTATNQYYEWAKMVKEICGINRVHFVDANCNLGYAKLTSSNGSLYVVDNIHQTELGGYIYAQNIWNRLKDIPLFYTAIPQ